MPDYDPQAARNLISAIFLLALRDYERQRNITDVSQFLHSDYAERLAMSIDVDISEIRQSVSLERGVGFWRQRCTYK